MGSLVCLPAQMACCFGSAACTLCSCCPNCGNSVTTRIMYGVMLLLGAIVAAIMLTPGLQDFLHKVPFCSDSSSNGLLPDSATLNCKDMVGYLSVYRICFAMTIFFVLMSVLMIGVRSTRDARAGIQNGFWGIKYLVLIGICVGAFFIPEQGSFGPTWMVFGMIGGFLFILVQVYLIIDFAYGWAERWMANYEENESKVWYAAMLISSLLMYALTLTGIILLFVYYTQADGCALNKFFISFNMILCVISSAVSILPAVQEHRPTSGLLQSSLISLYIIYLTWSAVANSPDNQCNPGFLGIIGQPTNKSQMNLHRDSIVGLTLWILVVIYSSIRTASSSERFTSDAETGLTEGNSDENNGSDESSGIKYNWSFFHFIFAIATLYIMMTLTNWYSPNSSLVTFSSNAASMWVKIVSSWLCVIIYNWWNIAPLLCPNRDFS